MKRRDNSQEIVRVRHIFDYLHAEIKLSGY